MKRLHALYLIHYYSLIQMMESKLLVGGKSIVDKTTEQDRALEQRQKELADQRVCIYKRKLYSQADRREKTLTISWGNSTFPSSCALKAISGI